MTWVYPDSPAATERGLTPGVVKGKAQRGVWTQGVEFALIDNRVMIDLDAIEARNNRIAEEQRTAEVRPKVRRPRTSGVPTLT
jgi:hypothetical protein